MKKALVIIAAVMALACSFSARAYATELTLTDPGVVGIMNGASGDNQVDEDVFAQHLLYMPMSTTATYDGHSYTTSGTEYSGTIVDNDNEVKYSGSGGITVPSTYVYALAKYDGQNAGYVLFYLPTYGYVLPQYSYSMWTNNPQKYEMGHYTPFNVVSAVPDGGATLAMLGIAFLGLGALRRAVKA